MQLRTKARKIIITYNEFVGVGLGTKGEESCFCMCIVI